MVARETERRPANYAAAHPQTKHEIDVEQGKLGKHSPGTRPRPTISYDSGWDRIAQRTETIDVTDTT